LEDDDLTAGPPGRGVALALAGLAVMGGGGWLAVGGAIRIIQALALSGSAVGLVFVALATTAEFIALVAAAVRRDVTELAVAGIIGSVAYNATATLGAAALAGALTVDNIRGAAAAAVLLPLVLVGWGSRRRRLGRPFGVLLLTGYATYVVLTLR
jgi:cation:H+ antiporter